MSKNDRKKHDGLIPDDEIDDIMNMVDKELERRANEPPPNYADPTNNPVPVLLEDARTLDPTQYGPATLQLLERIAFSDMGEYMSWSDRGIQIKSSEELTPAQRQLVTSVKEDKDGCITVTLCSKDQAIKLLAQASGYLKADVNLNGQLDIGLMDVLKAIDGRTRGLPPPKNVGDN